jgi:hypothetical protein
MGRELIATYEQVAKVADNLMAGGTKPTARVVREALGRGSMTTIISMLAQWRESRSPQFPLAPGLPENALRSVAEYVHERVAAAKAPLEAELSERQQAISDLGAESERQARVIEEQSDHLETIRAELAMSKARMAILETGLAESREETAKERHAAEAVRVDLMRAQLRLEALPSLEAELDEAREELAAEHKGRVEADKRVAVLEAEKSGIEVRLREAMERRLPSHSPEQ